MLVNSLLGRYLDINLAHSWFDPKTNSRAFTVTFLKILNLTKRYTTLSISQVLYPLKRTDTLNAANLQGLKTEKKASYDLLSVIRLHV